MQVRYLPAHKAGNRAGCERKEGVINQPPPDPLRKEGGENATYSPSFRRGSGEAPFCKMKNKLTRRHFFKSGAYSSGALMIGCLLPDVLVRAATIEDCNFFQPNPFLRIDKSGLVTLFVPKQEMGQAVNTS